MAFARTTVTATTTGSSSAGQNIVFADTTRGSGAIGSTAIGVKNAAAPAAVVAPTTAPLAGATFVNGGTLHEVLVYTNTSAARPRSTVLVGAFSFSVRSTGSDLGPVTTPIPGATFVNGSTTHTIQTYDIDTTTITFTPAIAAEIDNTTSITFTYRLLQFTPALTAAIADNTSITLTALTSITLLGSYGSQTQNFVTAGASQGVSQFLLQSIFSSTTTTGTNTTTQVTIVYGALASLTLASGGIGYGVSTTGSLTFTGGGGSGATGTFTTNSTGVITSVTLTAPGSGYTSAPTVTAPGGSGASITASLFLPVVGWIFSGFDGSNNLTVSSRTITAVSGSSGTRTLTFAPALSSGSIANGTTLQFQPIITETAFRNGTTIHRVTGFTPATSPATPTITFTPQLDSAILSGTSISFEPAITVNAQNQNQSTLTLNSAFSATTTTATGATNNTTNVTIDSTSTVPRIGWTFTASSATRTVTAVGGPLTSPAGARVITFAPALSSGSIANGTTLQFQPFVVGATFVNQDSTIHQITGFTPATAPSTPSITISPSLNAQVGANTTFILNQSILIGSFIAVAGQTSYVRSVSAAANSVLSVLSLTGTPTPATVAGTAVTIENPIIQYGEDTSLAGLSNISGVTVSQLPSGYGDTLKTYNCNNYALEINGTLSIGNADNPRELLVIGQDRCASARPDLQINSTGTLNVGSVYSYTHPEASTRSGSSGQQDYALIYEPGSNKGSTQSFGGGTASIAPTSFISVLGTLNWLAGTIDSWGGWRFAATSFINIGSQSSLSKPVLNLTRVRAPNTNSSSSQILFCESTNLNLNGFILVGDLGRNLSTSIIRYLGVAFSVLAPPISFKGYEPRFINAAFNGSTLLLAGQYTIENYAKPFAVGKDVQKATSATNLAEFFFLNAESGTDLIYEVVSDNANISVSNLQNLSITAAQSDGVLIQNAKLDLRVNTYAATSTTATGSTNNQTQVTLTAASPIPRTGWTFAYQGVTQTVTAVGSALTTPFAARVVTFSPGLDSGNIPDATALTFTGIYTATTNASGLGSIPNVLTGWSPISSATITKFFGGSDVGTVRLFQYDYLPAGLSVTLRGLNGTTASTLLFADTNITASKATADGYSTITTAAQLYNRAKSWLYDNFAGQTAVLVNRTGTTLDAGSYALTLATSGSVFSLSGNTITINAPTFADTLTTTGTITLNNPSASQINYASGIVPAGGTVAVAVAGTYDLSGWTFASTGAARTIRNDSGGAVTVILRYDQIANITPANSQGSPLPSVKSKAVTFTGFPTANNANGVAPNPKFGLYSVANGWTFYDVSSGTVQVSLSEVGPESSFKAVTDAIGWIRPPEQTIQASRTDPFDWSDLYTEFTAEDGTAIIGAIPNPLPISYDAGNNRFELASGEELTFAEVAATKEALSSSETGIQNFNTEALRAIQFVSNSAYKRIILPNTFTVAMQASASAGAVLSDFLLLRRNQAGTAYADPFVHGLASTASGLTDRPEVVTAFQNNIFVGATPAEIWSNPTRALTDKAGYSLATPPPTAAQTATQVRTELATELARLDVAVSTRLAASGYTTPPTTAQIATAVEAALLNDADGQALLAAIQAAVQALFDQQADIPVATLVSLIAAQITADHGSGSYVAPNISALALEASVQAIKTKTDAIPTNPLLTTDARLNNLDAAISSRASQTSVNAIPTTPAPTAAQNASQVRTELGTELARLDVAVSSRSTLTVGDIPAGLSAQQVWEYATRQLTGTQASNLAAIPNIPTNPLLASNYTPPPSAATIADAVWDETLSQHLTAGSTGAKLNLASTLTVGDIPAGLTAAQVWSYTGGDRSLSGTQAATVASTLATTQAVAKGKFVIDYDASTATQYNTDGTVLQVFDLQDKDGNPATSAQTAVKRVPR